MIFLTIFVAQGIWSGCVATGAATVEPGAVKADLTADLTIAGLVAKIERLENHIETVDSWTSIILALSVGLTLTAIPVSFFAYLLIHRVPILRQLSDRLKGKPC